MPRSGKKPSDDPPSGPQETALVVHPQVDRRRTIRESESPDSGVLEWTSQPGGPAYYRSLQAVWMQLGERWSSVCIMPSDPDQPVVEIGRALAQLCARLSIYPVEFIDASNIDLDTSSRLIARLASTAADRSSAQNGQTPTWAPPITRAVLALESSIRNPLAIPIAMAADGVVLCVRRGRDRLESVRETIDAIGDRLICSLLLD